MIFRGPDAWWGAVLYRSSYLSRKLLTTGLFLIQYFHASGFLFTRLSCIAGASRVIRIKVFIMLMCWFARFWWPRTWNMILPIIKSAALGAGMIIHTIFFYGLAKYHRCVLSSRTVVNCGFMWHLERQQTWQSETALNLST